MLIVEICQMFGWDYYQYLAQPAWFLDLIHSRMEFDGKKAKNERQK